MQTVIMFRVYAIQENFVNHNLEKYMSAVKRFNEAVAELAAKLEQISNARDEALKASADLRRELEATDLKLQDVAAAVRQQITMEFTGKSALHAADAAVPPVRRVS